jgi:hypothetical protein
MPSDDSPTLPQVDSLSVEALIIDAEEPLDDSQLVGVADRQLRRLLDG